MQHSGVKWLGEVPDHWEIVPLKRAFTRVRRAAKDDAGIVTAFRDGQVTLRSNRRSDGYTEADDHSGYQGIIPGDLAIHSMDAFAGAVGVSDSQGMSSPVLSVCAAQGGNDPRYMAYQLRLMSARGWIEALSRSVRERTSEFRWAEAGNQKIALPPVAEQTAIAAFLDNELARIDSLIDKQHDLIARLKERKNALLKMRILGLGRSSSTSRMTEHEWLAGIPADWKITKIGREFSLTLGKTLNAATNQGQVIVPYLRAGNVQDSGIDLQEVKTIGVTEKEMTDLALLRGDVVVVEGGAGFGRSDVLIDTLDGWVFQNHVIRARSRGTVTPEYLDFYIKYLRSIGHFEKLSAYATIPSISSDALGRIPIPKPPKEVATELVQSLTNDLRTHDTLIAKSFELIAGLQARRSALVSNAVTGKIDVRGEN